MSQKVYIAPGEFVIGNASQRSYSTVLGSCVSVVMWEPKGRFYAMCHYLMVGEGSRPSPELVGRYGSFLLPSFHRHILQRDILPEDVSVSLIGGASSIQAQGLAAQYRVGERNVDYGRAFLRQHGYQLELEDTGGCQGRRVEFDAATGKVDVFLCNGAKSA